MVWSELIVNKPGAILRLLSSGDSRAQFVPDDYYDRRILFLCLDLPQIMEHIEWFDDPDTMDEKLNMYLKEYFNVKVEVDVINEELNLPGVFSTYQSDFGGKEEILAFIANYFDNTEYDITHIGKSISFKYFND